MKKNIWDACKDCIIEIPDNFYHEENLLIGMIDTIDLPSKNQHNIMKESCHNLGAVCIKKNNEEIIGQEYYFTPKNKELLDLASEIWYKCNKEIDSLTFAEYSFDFHENNWELNLFDETTAAYYVDENTIEMKNMYFGFQHRQKQAALACMKNSVYPYKDKELLNVLSWTQFQRHDWDILIWRKKNAESVYFSRINFLWFLRFVQDFWWQEHIWDYLIKHSQKLKYYMFDINLQYTYKDGKMDIGKSSIYGLL